MRREKTERRTTPPVRIEKRWAGGSVDAMKALARELVALEPNVIVVISTPVTAAVMQETHTIPIFFCKISIQSAPAS